MRASTGGCSAASGRRGSTAVRSARHARRNARTCRSTRPRRRRRPPGFRPCLRCRPETAPELAAWRGTSNTVSRALALIDAGALDDDESRPPGRAPGRRRATAPAAVSTASRRVPRFSRADPACSPGQAIDPRDTAADGRSGAGFRIRQHPALQRDLPVPLRPAPGHAAPRQRSPTCRPARRVA